MTSGQRSLWSAASRSASGESKAALRIDYGPGYRLYFSWRGNELILLLIGGDKSTQQQDIATAKQLNKEYE